MFCMALFKTLPDNFFTPLASPLKEHYAALLLIYYRLFLEYQGSIERAQVVREYEDYFRSHEVFKGSPEEDPEEDPAEEEPEEEEGSEEDFAAESGDPGEESAGDGENVNGPREDPDGAGIDSDGIVEQNGIPKPDDIVEPEGRSRSPRNLANYFLRRLTAYGWLGNEVLEDFSQMVTMNSWAKPFFEALYSTSVGTAEEYESHIVAVYSLLTGGAARENGHYNLMSAHSHVRRLIESLKVLSQNIRTYLQNLYNEEAEVHEILHIHYDLYMHEVVDRAYNRLKTSDNLSKYRPLINRAVGAFLKDEKWLSSNAERMAVVKRTSTEQARKIMVEMLKEIRDSLRGIDPILDEIDDKNRRYSKISTQKIKTKLYSDATLQGKLRDIVTAVSRGRLSPEAVPIRLSGARFFTPESLYTRPKRSRDIEPKAVRLPVDDGEARYRQREMELKITGQLNPKKVAEFLRELRLELRREADDRDKVDDHDGTPVDALDQARDETGIHGALRSAEIARDLDGFIKLIYAAGYAEAGRADFPFEVVWEKGTVSVQGFHFQDHYYVERGRIGDGS